MRYYYSRFRRWKFLHANNSRIILKKRIVSSRRPWKPHDVCSSPATDFQFIKASPLRISQMFGVYKGIFTANNHKWIFKGMPWIWHPRIFIQMLRICNILDYQTICLKSAKDSSKQNFNNKSVKLYQTSACVENGEPTDWLKQFSTWETHQSNWK